MYNNLSDELKQICNSDKLKRYLKSYYLRFHNFMLQVVPYDLWFFIPNLITTLYGSAIHPPVRLKLF